MSKEEKKIKKKEKKKLKKLPLIIIITVILLLVIGCLGYIYLNNQKKLKNIKSHYNQYVITIKKTNIYNKNKQKIGTIEKDIKIELEKTTDSEYFKMKGLDDCYIYYKDIKKSEKINPNPLGDNYLVFNKNVTTTKTTELFTANKSVIKLNKAVSLPMYYLDHENYYVLLFNSLYSIKPETNPKIEDNENTKETEAKKISVLYYYEVQNECSTYNCVKTEDMKNQIKKLKEMGYHTLSKQEFTDFIYEKGSLKDKAVYIYTTNQNENINNIANELGVKINIEDASIHFQKNNQPAEKGKVTDVSKYQIKSYTTEENFIKMVNGEEVLESDPTQPNNQAIAVLNYHFFYDPNQGETCNEGICLTTDKFRAHLQYLKDAGYKTLTMNEFMRWMYGEIELPEKSVLITIDDGAMGTGAHNGNKLIPLLEEFDMHATLFLITGWWDISNYQSPNLDIQSHTNDMHQYGDCGRGQLVCYGYDKAKADLEQSVAIIGNTDSFCYPFYSYSDTAIQAVKDVGFKIAFAGGNRKATRNSNKWLIPRYPIHANITLDQFKSMVD